MLSQNTSDGIYIISDTPISKKNRKLVCSETPVKSKNLDDILNELCNSKSSYSIVAEKDALYEIGKEVKRVPKTNKSLAEALIENYSPHVSYIGLSRKNKSVVLEEPNELLEVLEKASKPNLPKKRKKQLLDKVDELIDLYLSFNLFKGYKQQSVLKKARQIPEQTAYSRFKESITTFVHKSNSERSKKPILDEIKKLYKNDYYELLVHLDTSDLAKKTDIAESLRKDVHAKEFFVFKNIPYIAVPCSKKDIDKICYSLNNKKGNYLSGMSMYKSSVGKAEASDICYTPELFMQVASHFNLRLFKGGRDEIKHRWNLRNIHAPEAWEVTRGNGSSVLVIDTGVDYEHMDLRNKFGKNKGYNFVEGNENPDDDNGHGTHVAGTIAGGSTGVAPMADLTAAKVLNGEGVGSTTDIIKAVDYAIDNNIDIINMSLGSPRFNYAFESICRRAYSKGVCLVAAAGNEGYGPEYPAAYEGVISVAALTSDNKHPGFSNIDKSVDISCPGVQVFSTFPGNHYRNCTGTSMASPHIAGIAALGYSVKLTLGPGGFEKVLKETAKELGGGEPYQREKYGAGIAQADDLVKKLYKSVFRGGWLWK